MRTGRRSPSQSNAIWNSLSWVDRVSLRNRPSLSLVPETLEHLDHVVAKGLPRFPVLLVLEHDPHPLGPRTADELLAPYPGPGQSTSRPPPVRGPSCTDSRAVPGEIRRDRLAGGPAQLLRRRGSRDDRAPDQGRNSPPVAPSRCRREAPGVRLNDLRRPTRYEPGQGPHEALSSSLRIISSTILRLRGPASTCASYSTPNDHSIRSTFPSGCAAGDQTRK